MNGKMIWIALLGAGTLLAETPAKAPEITDAHKAEYFKKTLAYERAQAAVQQAQREFQAAIADITKDCGADFHPQMNPTGDPICLANSKKESK